MDNFEEDEVEFDLYGDMEEEDAETLPDEMNAIIERLRDTMPYDRAFEMYVRSVGSEPSEQELEEFVDSLIAEQINAGYDNWDEGMIEFE